MIKLDDEIILNFDESCTKEEAVGKMLGWMRGHKRLKFVKDNKYGTGVEEQFLPYITHLKFPLDKQLTAIRQVVWNELMDIVDAADAEKKIGNDEEYHNLENKFCVKHDQLDKCDEDAENSVQWLLAINNEIKKGKDSLINIDLVKTEELGELHFTIESLDIWARKQLGVSVKDRPEDDIPKLSATDLKVKNLHELKDFISIKNSENDGYKRNTAFSLVLEEILKKYPNAKPAKVIKELKLISSEKLSVIKDASN